MHRLAVAAAVLASLAAPTVPLAYGETVNGFPRWEERVLHAWTNRARCDPQADLARCGGCAEKTCYTPVAPVVWHDGAARAARFHADEMRLQEYFDASGYSKCTVVSDIAARYPATCDGSASCACLDGVAVCNSVCTPFNGRTALFGATGRAEVLGSGYSDPDAQFYAWLYETSAYTTCSSVGFNRHRWTVLKEPGPRVGTGMSGPLAVMEFASESTAVKIPSGAHYPRRGASVEAWANWYDSANPTAAGVVVDGACTPLTLRRGTPENGAWQAVLTGLETGCHRYVFVFRDRAGALVTYPTTGSLGIGDASCPEFSTERPVVDAATCGPIAACGAGPGGCDDGDPCTLDACDPVAGCTHVTKANGAMCSDGNACNGAETCQSGACVAGTSLICADTNPCTANACDPVLGCVTTNVPDGASCADRTVCNGAETCQAGRCVAGTPLQCDDANPCTVDSCSSTGGCAHTVASNGASCADGDACDGVETCQGGACIPGTPLSCDDADACTADACNPLTGCAHVTVACDDGNPCTADACDAAVGCAHESAPAATECSDGLACNGVEHCDGAGACAAGASCVDPPPPAKKSSGCGSTGASGAGGPAIALVLFALLVGARRRRRA